MFSVISNLPETTALLTEDPRFPREYSVMQMQIMDPIRTIEYPTPAMFSCATAGRFHGIRINNQRYLIQQWNRNIMQYRTHLEKFILIAKTILSDNQSD